MHQIANREMSHDEALEFLADQVGGPAAQQNLGAPPMSLQLVENGFDFPAFMIKRGQFGGWRPLIVEKSGDQPIERLRVLDPFEPIVDDAQFDAIGLVPLIFSKKYRSARHRMPLTKLACMTALANAVLLTA
jgi:hypothetical protein